MRRIIVDLTRVVPGGENGGAKVVALELVRLLARLAPAYQFLLLTVARNHEELGALDRSNVTRLQIDLPSKTLSPERNLVIRLRKSLGKFIPGQALEKVAALYQRCSKYAPIRNNVLRHLDADLLFCPLTSPDFYDPAVPLVSIVHDLQHRYFPQFFAPSEVQKRDRAFLDACRWSQRVICTSDYVRQTILEHTDMVADRIATIPIFLLNRLVKPEIWESEQVLRRFGITAERFLLYPANFWPHKNHERLLQGFRTFLSTSPASDLKLVLTGAPGPRCTALREDCIADPILSSSVVFPGYVPESEFCALLYGCGAIVYPSLFEGFGMPLVEGMAASKPLLASNTASVPEIAGDAALYFDPTNPQEIADAITRMERNPELQRVLAEKAAERSRAFGRPEEMAACYLKVFEDAVTGRIG